MLRDPFVPSSGLSKSLIHMTSALVFLEGSASPQPLVNDLEACGVQVLAVLDAGSKLVQGVVRHAPDLVIGEVPQPGDALFETTQTLASVAPCPVIVFTHDGDAACIERAVASGIHVWVVNGYSAQRLRPLMQLAQARFQLGSIEVLADQHQAGNARLVGTPGAVEVLVETGTHTLYQQAHRLARDGGEAFGAQDTELHHQLGQRIEQQAFVGFRQVDGDGIESVVVMIVMIVAVVVRIVVGSAAIDMRLGLGTHAQQRGHAHGGEHRRRNAMHPFDR